MKKIIVANWKMYMPPMEEGLLAKEFVKKFKKEEELSVVICPTFLGLERVVEAVRKSRIQVGAQNVFWHEVGTFTGEISPRYLRQVGCDYVLIGHSERRTIFGETSAMANQKIVAALENGLTPILCVGETIEERRSKKTDFVIMSQVQTALKDIHLAANQEIIIAYEPVWAIQLDRIISALELEHVFLLIRQTLFDFWPRGMVSRNVRLLYGGSTKADNVNELLKIDLLSGFLVGGSSLRAEKFYTLSQKLK